MNKGMQRLMEKYGHMIESWHRENNYGIDYWIYLKDGYICRAMECGTIHEYNLKDVEKMLRDVVTEEEYYKPQATQEKAKGTRTINVNEFLKDIRRV